MEHLSKYKTMKQLFLLCLMMGMALAAPAQQTPADGCSQYRQGGFSYTDSVGNVVRVKRTKRHQMETNTATDVTTKFRIRWTDDCTYELKQVWSNSKARRRYNGTTTGVIISKPLGETGYEYTCACKGDMKKVTGVMRRL
jgi:hypothetical protein